VEREEIRARLGQVWGLLCRVGVGGKGQAEPYILIDGKESNRSSQKCRIKTRNE
jgi:hypothetical protein